MRDCDLYLSKKQLCLCVCVHVIMCQHLYYVVVPPRGRDRATSSETTTSSTRSLARTTVSLRTGRRLMPSLKPHLASAPAEDLHTSQVHMSHAHRAKKKGWTWRLASWNVRSMLDAEGSVERAKTPYLQKTGE